MSLPIIHEGVSRDLLSEIDLQNSSNVSFLLSNPPAASYSQSYLQQCLQIALASENLTIVQLLLENVTFSSSFLSATFTEAAANGTNPHLIYLLQQYLSPAESAYHQRQRVKFRQHGGGSFYLVDPMEPLQLNEMKLKLLKTDAKNAKKDTYLTYLRKVKYLNDCFLDAALGDRRYTLCEILSSKEFTPPNVTVVNEAFVAVCRRGNYIVATILSEYISQEAFDESFFLALDDSDTETISWLLSGRLGFQPSQERLEVEYRKIRLSTMDRPASMRFGRRGMPIFQAPRIERRLPIIESRVSEATKQTVENEIRAVQRAQERRNRQRQMFHIQDADIHSYSASAIDTPDDMEESAPPLDERGVEEGEEEEGGGGEEGDDIDEDVMELLRPHGRGGKPTLNEAIVAHITRRISRRTSTNDVEQTMTELVRLIRRFIPSSQQEAAVQLLGHILNNRSAKLFATTLEFLNSYGSTSDLVLETWIQGFLSESVVMHSCNPGALERVVTGLRGINDPELDKIFAQAEAPQLINIFLKSTFNIFFDEHNPETKEKAMRNAQRLAVEVVSRGVTESSESAEIQDKLMDFALTAIASIDSNLERYKAEVLMIVEIVVDNYDTHLKPCVMDLLLKQSGDTCGVHEESKGA